MIRQYVGTFCDLCLISCIVVISLLSGCAEKPAVMRFEMPRYNAGNPDGLAVWPEPPEVPRYTYVGDLTGEQNFGKGDRKLQKGIKKFWAVVAGIGFSPEKLVQLQRPQGVAVDLDGRVYVTDVSRQAIFVFDENAGNIELWGDWGKSAVLSSPIGIAVMAESIWVADSVWGELFRFNLDGELVARLGGSVLKRPTGLAVDSERGRIYVADTESDNIKVFDESGQLVDVIGEPGEGEGQFNAPTYMAFNRGRLYVSDTLNARVQVFGRQGEFIREVGQRGLYIGDLIRPKGVALDSEENLYVIESYYDHLLVFDDTGNLLLPIGGSGHAAGQFFQPAGIAVDNHNRIFIADMLNGRVAVYQYLGEN